nr:hypothetical protein CFP56_00347 [Quercus suber]
MFQSTFTNTITTPLPSNPSFSASSLIALLHDHSFLITMSPIVTRHSVRPGAGVASSSAPGETDQPQPNHSGTLEKTTYDVWEDLPLLPFHLLTHELHFTASFADRDDGVISWIQAPMGFVSKAVYSVRGAEQGDEAVMTGVAENEPEVKGGMVLQEHIETTCPMFFKLFVEATMVAVRRKMHERMIERVMEQGGGR